MKRVYKNKKNPHARFMSEGETGWKPGVKTHSSKKDYKRQKNFRNLLDY